MTEHEHVADHRLFDERNRLRAENAALRAEVGALRGVVVARGLEALQSTSGVPSDDFSGAVE